MLGGVEPNSEVGSGVGVARLVAVDIFRPARSYGDSEGDGEASVSPVAFFLVVFFAEADGEASVEAEVDVAWVVVAPVDVVAVASSFFWLWQPRNAASVSPMIKEKIDVFIDRLVFQRRWRAPGDVVAYLWL